MDPSTGQYLGVSIYCWDVLKARLQFFLFQPNKEPPARLHKLLWSEMDTKGLMWSKPVPLPWFMRWLMPWKRMVASSSKMKAWNIWLPVQAPGVQAGPLWRKSDLKNEWCHDTGFSCIWESSWHDPFFQMGKAALGIQLAEDIVKWHPINSMCQILFMVHSEQNVSFACPTRRCYDTSPLLFITFVCCTKISFDILFSTASFSRIKWCNPYQYRGITIPGGDATIGHMDLGKP